MSYIENLGKALRQMASDLQGVRHPWLIGGSCGLLMQGVPLAEAPRDVDVYADADGVRDIHAILNRYSTDEQVEDRSPIYYSILSHYAIGDVNVELVGGFRVTACDSVYRVDAARYYERHAASYSLNGEGSKASVKLMPLEHELLFNVLRNRQDRYQAIAKVLVERFGGATKALEDIMAGNEISEQVTKKIGMLLAGRIND